MPHPPRVTISRAALETFARALHNGTPDERRPIAPPLALPDGGTVTVRLLVDDSSSLSDWPDCWGTVGESPRNTRGRPAGFTGAACKLRTRSGSLWWQPPADVAKDAAALARVRDRVRAYYLEHWYFIGVQVVRHSATVTGPFGGKIMEAVDSALFGIESDAGDYFAEVLHDLLHQVGIDVEKGDTHAAG